MGIAQADSEVFVKLSNPEDQTPSYFLKFLSLLSNDFYSFALTASLFPLVLIYFTTIRHLLLNGSLVALEWLLGCVIIGSALGGTANNVAK